MAQYLAGQGEQLPVRLVITGGEALTGEHLQRIRQAFAPQQLFNAYGPTETVVMPLACLAPDTLPADLGSVPIGRVVGSRTAYILDENLALLPQGGIGELYVGGAGLAQGYHDRPGSAPSASLPTRSVPQAGACTAPVTWCAWAAMAWSSTWGVPTSR